MSVILSWSYICGSRWLSLIKSGPVSQLGVYSIASVMLQSFTVSALCISRLCDLYLVQLHEFVPFNPSQEIGIWLMFFLVLLCLCMIIDKKSNRSFWFLSFTPFLSKLLLTPQLIHWTLGDVAFILKVQCSNSLHVYRTVAWAFTVKFLPGECHRTWL